MSHHLIELIGCPSGPARSILRRPAPRSSSISDSPLGQGQGVDGISSGTHPMAYDLDKFRSVRYGDIHQVLTGGRDNQRLWSRMSLTGRDAAIPD